MKDQDQPNHPVLRLVGPDEETYALARADENRILVTDRRVAVGDDERVALDIPLRHLRRVQFDIERARPATLVLVPEHPADPPQILTVPVEHYEEVAQALAKLGRLISV